jgi:hypothetical protein
MYRKITLNHNAGDSGFSAGSRVEQRFSAALEIGVDGGFSRHSREPVQL